MSFWDRYKYWMEECGRTRSVSMRLAFQVSEERTIQLRDYFRLSSARRVANEKN